MSELSLVYPMLALVLLTFGVLIVLFRSRVRMVREGLAPVSYFRTFQGSVWSRNLRSSPQRHFANLFEAPTLFYAGCLAAMVTGVTGTLVRGRWPGGMSRCDICTPISTSAGTACGTGCGRISRAGCACWRCGSPWRWASPCVDAVRAHLATMARLR